MVHPGILRKQEAIRNRSKAEEAIKDGPISLLIMYILDIIGDIGKLLFNMVKGFRISGSKFIYDLVYKDGSRIIPSAEKYGSIVNLKPLRIIMSILYPPLGVFFARGVTGFHHILICFGLTYYNIFFGIAYSLIIMHIPYYGDRFSDYDYYRILTIRQLISNCRNITFKPPAREYFPLILFLSFIAVFLFIIYITIKFL